MTPRRRADASVGAVVVGVDAAALRRAVGPTARCVLETLTAAAHGGLAGLSIRAVALELGVSKNTVQLAMAVLRNAGLVEAVASRRDDGRFAAGTYRVTTRGSVLAPADSVVGSPESLNGPTTAPAPASPSIGRRPSRRSRRAARPVVVEQLSLLEV